MRTDPGVVDRTIPIPAAGSSASGGSRYEIRRELGRGGEGAVYLAFDRHAEEVVALKVLDDVTAGSEHLSRLRRELAMARRITHPGIVRLHDLVEIDGRWALSMEYIDGRSLESRIESGQPFSADEIGTLARELAAALAAAHDAGVTHRDLKPANVLLRADGRPVISDFGISRVHSARTSSGLRELRSGGTRVTQEGALVGTPLYMSPEQLEGQPSAGPIVDVYALGLILFEVATGQVPHAEGTLNAIIRRRTSEDAPKVASLRPDLPPVLADVIDRCLARAADRFADGTAIVAALAPRPVGPSSRGGSSLNPPRRRWPLIGLAGAGVLVAGLAFVGFRMKVAQPSLPGAVAAPTAAELSAVPPSFTLHASGHRRVTYEEGCEEFPSFFPDGKRILFDATVGAHSNLFVVDIDSGATRKLTTSPGWDFAGKVSPDGKQVAFLRGDNELMGSYVIDAEGATPARFLIAGGIRPSFTADGKHVWAGPRVRPTRVDAATAAVIEEAPLPENRLAWHVLSLANGDLAIAMPPFTEGTKGGISTSSGGAGARLWRDILVDSVEEVMALSPDSSHLISARYGPNASELLAIPLGGGATLRLSDTAISPAKGLAFSADGKRVAWSTCRSYASIVPLIEKTSPPPQAWEDLEASRLPDGKLAVVSARDGTMKPWIVDPSGHTPPRVLDVGAPISDASASPDGKLLALTTTTGIVVVGTEGQAPPRALTTESGDSEASFSRDGQHVLFTRRADGKTEIHRASLNGDAIVRTHAVGIQAVAFDDSDDFVFIEERAGKQQPMIWRAAKAVAEPLAASMLPGRYGRPEVSPDGKLVALAHRGVEIIVLNRASGRVERTLTMGGDQVDRPVFLADGSLYVIRVRWLGDIWVADIAP